MYPFEENKSESENSLTGREDIYPETLDGGGIFLNRENRKHSHWSVPWSDLMMTMFILFAVLYVYHSSNREVEASSKEPEIKYREEIIPVRKEVFLPRYRVNYKTLRAENPGDISSIDLAEEKAVKIILPGDVLFDTGEAELKSGAIGSLMAVGQLIKDRDDYAVTVAGHTDNIPISSEKFPSNWELSSARACVAAKFLIEKTALAPSRIQVIGYAENRPVDSNETPEGRKANRRVEIIISKEHITDNLTSLPGRI